MRPIYLARMPERKTRPVLLLTREITARAMRRVTVAPITTTIRGTDTEVPVGASNGIDHDSVVNCDSIETIPASALGREVGFLLDRQENALAEAIIEAFRLRTSGC